MNSNATKSTDSPATVSRCGATSLNLNQWVIALAVGVGFTVIAWSPLWLGDGFVGGDIYAYFLPQKTFYADALRQGTIPLWNNLTGFGYPLVGESQTGVFYLPNLLLYTTFDVQTAYNVNHILHYVFAFVGTVLLARRLGVSLPAALFAGLVFVYGWFPVRSCHEWAIITGSYLPWAVWCVESYLAQRQTKCALGLAVLTGLQLLAGHFNLAFITTLTVGVYALLRGFVFSSGLKYPSSNNPSDDDQSPGSNLTLLKTGIVFASLVAGYGLAAIQLVPSYELKQQSQRAETIADLASKDHPQYGHIPPWYLSQMIMPWTWYGVDVDLDAVLNANKSLSVSVPTNKVEAHLYFGFLPMLLALFGLIHVWRAGLPDDSRRMVVAWFVLGLLAAIYATGWLYPLIGWLPGFSYFRGPGRYGIITTLAAAMCAAYGVEQLIRTLKMNAGLATTIVIAMIGITTWDLMTVASKVGFHPASGYTFIVGNPPVNHRFDREFNGQPTIRAVLEKSGNQPVRLYAPGPNIPNIIGVSSYPVYLGIGPKEYFDPDLQMPELPEADRIKNGKRFYSRQQLEWMYEHGITHILSFEPVDSSIESIREIWRGFDPVLNPALARFREPLFLSELGPPNDPEIGGAFRVPSRLSVGTIDDYGINAIELSSRDSGEPMIVRELNFPGWKLENDGFGNRLESSGPFRRLQPAKNGIQDRLVYRPWSIYSGAIISLVTLSGLTVCLMLTWIRTRATIHQTEIKKPATQAENG